MALPALKVASFMIVALLMMVTMGNHQNDGNLPPEADAGPDQDVQLCGDTVRVQLDGTGSFDPDPEDTIKYVWAVRRGGPAGPVVFSSSTLDPTPYVSLDATGTYVVSVKVTQVDENSHKDRDSSTITVDSCEETNQPPDCTGAAPSTDLLWPPNHKFAAVSPLGVTDPDGDTVSINVDSIMQDEPVDGRGSGNTSPDGKGVGSATAEVRAEREGGGNGRVYTIGFTADDGNGGSCAGTLTVGVPHDKRNGSTPVDDGPDFDSTQP